MQTIKAALLLVLVSVGVVDARGAVSANTAPYLVIQTHTVPNGELGTPYSASLVASGGKPGYNWLVAAGSLPQGLSLSKAGLLSGTPAKGGVYLVGVAVTDASQPQKRVAEFLFVNITEQPLSIATASLPNGVVGQAYAFAAQAKGGSGSYTWSTKGQLPTGLTLDGNSGVISGTPTTAASSSFTLIVKDTSSPILTQTATDSITIAAAPVASAPSGQTTWYVRPDGGTRYSANVSGGQCDGLGDAPYPGKGVNQHCAFNDIRLLWQDGSYAYAPQYGVNFPGNGWIGKGGDTYLIRGSIAAGTPAYRLGRAAGSSNGEDPAQVALGNPAPFRGWPGDPFAGAPTPPAGTAAQPTRILGENWQNCHAQGARTALNPGNAVTYAFAISSSYVDVQCFDISDRSDCLDCGGQDSSSVGIMLSNTADHLLLQDIRIHGMQNFGLYGPSGDGDVFRYLSLVGNGAGGWNADAGDGKTGTGSLLVQNYEILWNGCREEFPIVDALPYKNCRDQNSGGYGDGFGTATVVSPAPGWQAHFDAGTVAYNTQDGLDALHLIGNGSSMTVTRTLAYGNMGQQVKVGGAAGTLEDSVIVGNCDALANALPGTPAGFNAQLSDFCRAGNQPVLMTAGHGTTTAVRHNTIEGAGALLVGYVCDGSGGNCDSTALLDVRDNIFLGNPDPTRGNPGANYLIVIDGTYPTQAACAAAPDNHHSWTTDGAYGCANNVFFNPGSFNSNNVYFQVKDRCSDNNGSSNLCVDPGLLNETVPLTGYPNLALSTNGGAAVRSGTPLNNLTNDFTGKPFLNPPSIGALEQGSVLSPYHAEE